MPVQADDNVRILKAMVRGAYDLQALRMQGGLRLCANFRAKLGLIGPSDDRAGSGRPEDEEEDEAAKKLIEQLRTSYKRLTDGIAKNRTLPAEKGFAGDELIGSYAELVLVNSYFRLESEERQQFGQLEFILNQIPIYTQYLEQQRGIGPAMAGVLISSFVPESARHVSSFWKFAGLDVGPDGLGRSRRQEHLVERQYKDKNGKMQTRMGITYDPWVKAKLMGVLATSMLRLNSPWRKEYDNYRHRLETDPLRVKLSVNEWKKRRQAGEDVRQLWPPGRIHMAACRYMIKMFLLDFWRAWRTLEGLPVTLSYHEQRRGRPHAA